MFDALRVTASELQAQLSAGKLMSVKTVESDIAQIQAHNNYLHAVLELSPKATAIVYDLDQERGRGILCSPLHGILSAASVFVSEVNRVISGNP